MNESNPNGANGTQSDPREQIMWDIYVTNLAQGKENAYEAAKEAGYEESTSKQITVRSWFLERKAKLKRKEMFSKAERNLDNVLDLETLDKEGNTSPQLLKIKTDVSTTIVKTLGKDEGYSDRTEVTGKDGGDIKVNQVFYGDRNNNTVEIRTETLPIEFIKSTTESTV